MIRTQGEEEMANLTPKVRKHIRALNQALNKVEAEANRWPEGSVSRKSVERKLEATRYSIKLAEEQGGPNYGNAILRLPIPKVFGTCIVWNTREEGSADNVQIRR
jgi:hypothetical protein